MRSSDFSLCSNTLFVAALVDCFQGGASTPDNPFVSAEDLFVDLKKRMEALLDKTAAAKLAAKKVADAEEKVANAAQGEKGAAAEDDEEDRAADAAALALYRGPNQTPVLVVPRKQPGVLANPVCCRCGPPCAPERPYVSS